MALSHTHWKVDEELLITGVSILEEEKLGEGSFGAVHKGHWHGQQVAVKRLHPVFFEACNDQSQFVPFLKKFEREWLIIKSLNHTNILSLYGIFQDEQSHLPSIVTEEMDESLDSLLKSKEPLGLHDRIAILTQVANALEYMHSQTPPVIHRDLAPKNILVNNKGKVVKLADYGQAKIAASSKPGTLMPGTEGYMPPEARQERPVSSSFDIFSFGVVMLEVLGGEEVTPGPLLGSGLKRVPEIERRKNDLDKFKNAAKQGEEDGSSVLKLHALVLSCLQDMGCDRPSAAEVGQSLKKLSHQVQRTLQFCESTGTLVVKKDGTRNPDAVVATSMAQDGFFQ
eukprot:m.260621 g.260621  ORF g.260621 m.260621 type:complete len:340 (+) comp40438_c0_seq2:2163-3182(+)